MVGGTLRRWHRYRDGVTALLQHDGGQARCVDGRSDLHEVGGANDECAEWVMFVGVDAQRHDQGIHVSVGDASECSVECRHPTLHGRSGGKWQVQVPVLAVALTDLARVAREPGKLEDGVRMDRDEKHIAAFGENGLRAVAMVIVDVEDRDTDAPPSRSRCAAMAALLR